MSKNKIIFAAAFICFMSPGLTFAQSPTVIHYRGHLDVPAVVPAGIVQRDLTFSLYTLDTGGTPIWTETQTLDIYDGNFAAILGTTTPITPSLFTGEFRYLGIQVATDPELTPRQRIAAVPYAMQAEEAAHAQDATHADDADTLGGGAAHLGGPDELVVETSQTNINGAMTVQGSLEAQDGLVVSQGIHAFGIFTFGLPFVDTDTVFRINETDSIVAPSQRNRFAVTTRRFFFTDYGIINHLVVDANGWVGINTDSPQGNLDVFGPIYQRGGLLHSDYVFEEDYDLESIEKHSEEMWENKHLPDVPPREVDEKGREVLELGSHRQGMLVELEKAHIYIDQLNKKIKELESKIEELERKSEDE